MNRAPYRPFDRRKVPAQAGAEVLRLRNWFSNWRVILRRFYRRYK